MFADFVFHLKTSEKINVIQYFERNFKKKNNFLTSSIQNLSVMHFLSPKLFPSPFYKLSETIQRFNGHEDDDQYLRLGVTCSLSQSESEMFSVIDWRFLSSGLHQLCNLSSEFIPSFPTNVSAQAMETPLNFPDLGMKSQISKGISNPKKNLILKFLILVDSWMESVDCHGNHLFLDTGTEWAWMDKIELERWMRAESWNTIAIFSQSINQSDSARHRHLQGFVVHTDVALFFHF